MNQDTEVIIKRRGGFGRMILGVIVGSMVGGTVALLAAPRTGVETRRMIADKGMELRDRASDMVDDVRGRAMDMAGQVRDQAQSMVSNIRGNNMSESQRLERDVNILESDIDKTYNL